MKNKIGNMETIFLTLICTVIIIILNTCYAQNDKTMMYKEWEREVLKNRQYIPKELNKLTDSSRIVREKTVDFLIRTPDPRSIQPLAQLLKTEEIAKIRRYIIEALTAIAKYENEYKINIVPILRKALNDTTVGVQIKAAQSLIDLDEEEYSIKTLIKIFKKEHTIFSQSLKAWAETELCRPDLPEEEQIRMARENKETIKRYTPKLLIAIGSDEVISELKKCLNSDDDWVRFKANEIIKTIEMNKKSK